jgi:hypothetical protein
MSQVINQLSVLKVLKEVSTPYVFIDDVQPRMDIHSKAFISVFKQLVEDKLISSTQSPNCGLKMSGDGLPVWSGVDISITGKGELVLNPIPQLPWYKNSSIVAPMVYTTLILIMTSLSTYFYDQYKAQNSNKLTHKVAPPVDLEAPKEIDP